MLLSLGVHVNAVNKSGQTAAMLAHDSAVCMHLLNRHCANADAVDVDGNTILHLAGGKRWKDDFLHLLLKRGVPLEATNVHGQTAVMYAAKKAGTASARAF